MMSVHLHLWLIPLLPLVGAAVNGLLGRRFPKNAVAFVGNVGSGTVLDFTALGDAVNVGSRLQALASPGEVVLAASLYELVEAEYPGGRSDRVAIRGRDEPVDIVVLPPSG